MKFIRIDTVGEWRDKEHVSSVGVSSFVAGHERFEEGISCYSLENPVSALEDLHNYWVVQVMLDMDEFDNMQITIFEGYKLDVMGTDHEDMAICERTIKEIPAREIMEKLDDLYWDLDLGDIDHEEYENKINDLYNEIIKE